MEFQIRKSAESDSDAVHQQLRGYNRRFMRESCDYSYHISEQGRIVAGIVASSVLDALEVEYLFVDEAYRGRGLGGRLLEHVERLAAEHGIRRVLLNTYSFQAPDFYRKCGYKQLFAIDPALEASHSFSSARNWNQGNTAQFSGSADGDFSAIFILHQSRFTSSKPLIFCNRI